MKSKIILYLVTTFSIFLFPIICQAKININLDVPENFKAGQEINFDYSISSDQPVELAFQTYVQCKNGDLPTAPLVMSQIIIPANGLHQASHQDITIQNEHPPQTCAAIVEVLRPINQTEKKDFKINTPENLNFQLLTCLDQKCQKQSKIFKPNSTVFFDFQSNQENLDITGQLIAPNGSTSNLSFPSQQTLNQKGDYQIKILVKKPGFDDLELEKTIKVPAQSANIQSSTVCNFNGQCNKGENAKNCSVDCGGPLFSSSISFYLAVGLLAIFLIILLSVIFKTILFKSPSSKSTTS
ncbi:MAG: hypothetical protein GF332_02005 [Candidatus Moranbacteria bacterium]|nr:hypothetical protein [Candidatus Moranbacteria bacterium]